LGVSGVALGGLALGGAAAGAALGKTPAAQQCAENGCNYPADPRSTLQYSYLNTLRKFTLDMQSDLADDEMRITFLGTFGGPPVRKAQQQMSIFVEVGPWVSEPEVVGFGKAQDSFVFDLGGGCLANYAAMGIPYSRMDKVFLNHLHADHMADLTNLYCFGPVFDRKWPLYIWGQGPSTMESPPGSGKYYDDGVDAFCTHLREACRWHTEGQSYLATTFPTYRVPTQEDWHTPVPLTPVGDDAKNDSYAIIPIQLDWTKKGLDEHGAPDYSNIAYENKDTGVRITHFPVIHYRKGSLGYKLEWNGLSLIYTSDTRPDTVSILQANNGGKGVDVFIHEMCPAQELGVMKTMGLTWPDHSAEGFETALDQMNDIVESAHTVPGAYGHLLSQMNPRPRLAVATHFPVEDDIVECAYNSVRQHFPEGRYPEFGKDIMWPTDLMVVKVKKGKHGKPPKIEQFMGEVSDYTWGPSQNVYGPMADPKYEDPTTQLDLTNLIEPGPDTYCENGY
jgi:ribonuclease Z